MTKPMNQPVGMKCSDCGKKGYKVKESVGNLPLGWTKVYVTVKQQKKERTDIRNRQATIIKMTPVFCDECSQTRVITRYERADQMMEFTVKI